MRDSFKNHLCQRKTILQTLGDGHIYVMVQFCPWFKFYFPLCLDMVMYDNEFETMKNKI